MSQNPISFLDLPPEIRNKVYHEIFTSNPTIIHVHESDKAADHHITTTTTTTNSSTTTPTTAHTILQTSKQIHLEAKPHYILTRTTLLFTTSIRNNGPTPTHPLPKLGQQLSGSIFTHITTIHVGISDMWRVISSLGSLKARLKCLKVIRVRVVKRMPWPYWLDRFPNILSFLTAQRQDLTTTDDPSIRGNSSKSTVKPIPELELARFRAHIRSHPLLNEDEHHLGDDEEDEYTDDRGDQLLPRSVGVFSSYGVEVRVCARWVLVDWRGGGVIRCVVETEYDVRTGKILYVGVRDSRFLPSRTGGGTDTSAEMVSYSTLPVLQLEKTALAELEHSSFGDTSATGIF